MFKMLFFLGQKWRNPSMRMWYHWLKASEKWSVEELEQHQFKKLKEITQLAYLHSAFYKKYYDENYFHPDDLKQLSDISKIPILSKKLLLENVAEIHTNLSFNKIYKATTSGSSGTTLQFNRDESADSFNRASKWRGYSWYGVQPWEYSGYFWGFNFSAFAKIKTRILDLFQNRFRVFTYEDFELKKLIQKLQKATYISGYSSMIYETAKIINSKNELKPKGIKLVIGTSEKIFDSYQEKVQKAFGVKLSSEYGATETGIIGYECTEGNVHINMEGVIVEELNHEIIITNLIMQSFPIIRYQLGDYIQLAPKETICTCGMKHRIIKDITGRIGETIYGKEQLYPSLYFYYIFKNLAQQQINLNYLVIQNEKGFLIFHIEQKISGIEKQQLIVEIQKYFKDDIKFTIVDESFPKDSTKKATSFISYIKV